MPACLFAGHRRFRLSVPDWAAWSRQWRTGVRRDRRNRALLGRHRLAERGLGHRVFARSLVLLLSPKGDQAYAGAMAFALGVAGGVPAAAIVKFAVLPGLESFPAFCLALGLCLVPVGFMMAHSRQPMVLAVVTAMGFNFMPLLAPANQMSYDTAQFYNSALAIFAGCAIAPLSFRLLPPLSPGSAGAPAPRPDLARSAPPGGWPRAAETRSLARPHLRPPRGVAGSGRTFAARAATRGALRRRRHHATSSVSPACLISARSWTRRLPPCRSATRRRARTWLARLDHRLASATEAEPDAALALRARARILALSEALARACRLFRQRSGGMRFTEIDLFGVYVAPISLMMVAAWLVTIALRRVAGRFGLLRHVWHPALFVFAVYMIVLSSTVLISRQGERHDRC